jgi:putative glutamine amidotransferase
VIGGGDDIAAEIYQRFPLPDVRIDPARDRLELRLLDVAVPRGIPLLGVCRGAQMINVCYGGSLHQNIYEVYRDAPRRWTPLPAKTVHVVTDTRLYEAIKFDCLRVNSLHTQSIDRLGDTLRISGWDEYGIVQSIEDPAADFCVGVQWHPEFLIYRRPHRRLFRAFSEAVRRQASIERHDREGSAEGPGGLPAHLDGK